jgi:hypothetical protein
MKYEFRKQLFSKILILVALAVLEVVFLYGLFADKENVMGLSIGLFIFISIAAVLFVSFESIFTFSNDLKTKQSYMLFLTPNSTYKIVGAKVLSSVIYVLLTAAALVALTLVDFGVFLVKKDEIAKFIEEFQKFIQLFFKANINVAFIITLILYFLFDLIGIMVIGMASITLSSTLLSNSKGKAVVSIIFFFGINFLVSKLGNLLIDIDITNTQTYYYGCIYSAVVMLVFYFATAWMLDKKVSV